MKLLKLTLILELISWSLFANAQKYQIQQEHLVLEEEFQREVKFNQSITTQLAEIKYSIINGNFEKAKSELLKLKFDNNFGRVIQKRYEGMILFLENNFKESYSVLSYPELNTIENYPKICYLKVLNLLMLKDQKIRQEWQKCFESTGRYAKNEHIWLNNMVKLFTRDDNFHSSQIFEKISIENEKIENAKLVLKLSLYLGQQDKLLDKVNRLDEKVYEDKQMRELIGLLYYRNKQIKNAYNFIEDLTTVNSENLKGNIYLAQDKLELAYAQFKLSLNKKNNSQNSLERAIPIAWILGQYNEGYNFVERLDVQINDKASKYLLEAIFLTKLKRFAEAENRILRIINYTNHAEKKEVQEIMSLVSLHLGKKNNLKNYASKACKNRIGVMCWLLYQENSWPELTKTVKRTDAIFEKEDYWYLDLTTNKQEPLKEDVMINQKDIEELDDSLISLNRKE
jgi:hypothetical protein